MLLHPNFYVPAMVVGAILMIVGATMIVMGLMA